MNKHFYVIIFLDTFYYRPDSISG